METAPDLKPGYPSRGKRLGPAWREAWARLGRTWIDGHVLSAAIAAEYDLSPDTVRALLYRMVNAGYLDRRLQVVETARGPRDRTHFRRMEP